MMMVGIIALIGLVAAIAPAVVAATAAFGASHAMVNITAQFNPSTQGYASPAFYQYLQREIQEAVARWSLNNPGTGFGLPGRA
jgi:hypothetical protein